MRTPRSLFSWLPASRRQVLELRLIVLNSQELIMATQAQIAAGIATINTQLERVGQESSVTLEKVRALEEQINNGDVSPELQAAFDALKAQVQVVDDLVPDAVEVPSGGDQAGTASQASL